jgi:hypothetical protein
MLTISLIEAIGLYQECVDFDLTGTTGLNSNLRLKTEEIFKKSLILQLNFTCYLVFKTLAKAYMTY